MSLVTFGQLDVQSTELTCPDYLFYMSDPSSISTLMDPIFDFDGTQLYFTDTNDLSKTGIYNLRAHARYDGTVAGSRTHYDHFATLDIQITVVDLCETSVLTIDPLIFPSGTELLYNIEDTASAVFFDNTMVIETETTAPCPVIIFSVVNSDTSTIDPDVFTFDEPTSTLTIQTDDLLKDGIVSMQLQAKYTGSKYTNFATQDFTVDLIDVCKAQAEVSSIGKPEIQD